VIDDTPRGRRRDLTDRRTPNYGLVAATATTPGSHAGHSRAGSRRCLDANRRRLTKRRTVRQTLTRATIIGRWRGAVWEVASGRRWLNIQLSSSRPHDGGHGTAARKRAMSALSHSHCEHISHRRVNYTYI